MIMPDLSIVSLSCTCIRSLLVASVQTNDTPVMLSAITLMEIEFCVLSTAAQCTKHKSYAAIGLTVLQMRA